MTRQEEVITVQEITSILKNYHIGKKPLARLLGWGETTIIRYMDGDIPTKEYSEKLKMILNSPMLYYELLLKNKENLTDIAFKKSKKAVLGKMTESKIRMIAQYFVNFYNGETTPAQIQTLLYFAQGFSLGFYDVALFREEYRITSNYCPYPQLYQEMLYTPLKYFELEEKMLTHKEKKLINTVAEAFSWYGPKAFLKLAEKEKSSLKISRDKENNKVVTENSIRNHFKKEMEQSAIKELEQIEAYIEKYVMELKKKTKE